MSEKIAKRGLIVLDRDGVINKDSAQFVKSADEWQALPGSIAAVAALSRAGFQVAVASNQSGLARGLFDRKALDAMHEKLHALVAAEGGHIGCIVFCPHGPDDDCDCRKPKPGLLLQIAEHYELELDGVPVIGDSLRDLQAAATVGARPILVRTGNGRKTEQQLGPPFENIDVFDDLAAAATALIVD
jgi:D-glycero-D-manno-heptose 1,7-bisphosphate phosphatase